MELAEKENFQLAVGAAVVAGCKDSLFAAEEPGKRERDGAEPESELTEGPAEASVPDWRLDCCR